jgi:hypothetical protein
VKLVLGAILVLAIVGCSGGARTAAETIRFAAFPDKRVSEASAYLSPNFEYMRARVNGRLIFLALGYREAVSGAQDALDVYFSADGEVLKLRKGRIVSFVGLGKELTKAFPDGIPDWSEKSVSYRTVLDDRPSYNLGQTWFVEVAPVAGPPSRKDLIGLAPASLLWFKERLPSEAIKSGFLQAPVYAVTRRNGRDEVVYSEQCLEPKLCFSLQRWRSSGAF